MDRKVVLSKTSARRNRTAFKYWLKALPVSCLKRWRRRDGERWTNRANSDGWHVPGSLSILETTSMILRSMWWGLGAEDVASLGDPLRLLVEFSFV